MSDDKAARQAAFYAGIRQNRCAVCRTEIDGKGICGACRDAIQQLGGLDGLKQAVRYQRWADGQ